MWAREASRATGGVRHRFLDAADEEEEDDDEAVALAPVVVAIASLGSTPMAYMAWADNSSAPRMAEGTRKATPKGSCTRYIESSGRKDNTVPDPYTVNTWWNIRQKHMIEERGRCEGDMRVYD